MSERWPNAIQHRAEMLNDAWTCDARTLLLKVVSELPQATLGSVLD